MTGSVTRLIGDHLDMTYVNAPSGHHDGCRDLPGDNGGDLGNQKTNGIGQGVRQRLRVHRRLKLSWNNWPFDGEYQDRLFPRASIFRRPCENCRTPPSGEAFRRKAARPMSTYLYFCLSGGDIVSVKLPDQLQGSEDSLDQAYSLTSRKRFVPSNTRARQQPRTLRQDLCPLI